MKKNLIVLIIAVAIIVIGLTNYLLYEKGIISPIFFWRILTVKFLLIIMGLLFFFISRHATNIFPNKFLRFISAYSIIGCLVTITLSVFPETGALPKLLSVPWPTPLRILAIGSIISLLGLGIYYCQQLIKEFLPRPKTN